MGYRVQDDNKFGNHMIVGVIASVLKVQGNLSFDSRKMILMVYCLSTSKNEFHLKMIEMFTSDLVYPNQWECLNFVIIQHIIELIHIKMAGFLGENFQYALK